AHADALEAIEDIAPWRDTARRAAELYRDLLTARPDDRVLRRGLTASRLSLGEAHRVAGDLADALAILEESETEFAALAAGDINDIASLHYLALTKIRIGKVLFAQGMADASFAVFDAALDISERLVATEPDNLEYRHELYACHANIGLILEGRGDRRGALASFDRAIDIASRLIDQDPSNGTWRAERQLIEAGAARVRRALAEARN
ncbi:MAG: hypothetical protein O7A03_12770, partial [Alphaproteobacteria bacterium]|nr:hypothetical protein [Alphaproteobacteria bacterium]